MEQAFWDEGDGARKNLLANGDLVVHRACTGNAERASGEDCKSRTFNAEDAESAEKKRDANFLFARWRNGELREDTMLEFLRRDADGSAMFGAGNFPESSSGAMGVNQERMADRDVAVGLAVDQ